MKKLFKRVLSQLIVFAIAIQLVGQYGYQMLPQVISYAEEVETQNENSDVELLDDLNAVTEELVTTENISETEETTTEPEVVYEDWTITSDTTLSEEKEVNNLTISDGTLNLNGNRLKVYGDVILNSNGILNCNKGVLECNNFLINYWSYLDMKNINDLLLVNGNFEYNGGYVNSSNTIAGTIEVKGDFNINNSSFKPSKEHKVVLSGTEMQTIRLNSAEPYFNFLEITNTSKEGVVSETPVPANKIFVDGNSNVNFAGATIVGDQLTEDIKWDGDYYLAAGTLDLNGKTLTINGNLIQAGGEIVLNGGTLDVKGDYRIQSRTENEDGTYSYSYSVGYLTMTNEADYVKIGGDFVTDSSVSHSGKLTAGTMEIDGDFSQLNSKNINSNFLASGDHIVVLSGTENQSLKFASTGSCFMNLEIANKKSVNLTSDVVIKGAVYDNTSVVNGSGYLRITKLEQLSDYKFSGNVRLENDKNNSILYQDLIVGNITANYLNLNTYKVSADNIQIINGLYVEGGTVECKNNLSFDSYSYFSMDNENDYVHVGGDFTTKSHHDIAGKLTNGVLNIKGDFIQTYNAAFICEGDHITILSGKNAPSGREYIQTVKFYSPGTSKFNILRITKPISQYKALNSSGTEVDFENVYVTLEENYSDLIKPIKVDGIIASDVNATSVHISWNPSTDNIGIMGYEIYRDNVKIQTTSKTEFTDNHLLPETEYTYIIYAFDECRNFSDESEELVVVTKEDTTKPDTPQNLKIRSRTGSSITIVWNSSNDDVKTIGYKVFRNDVEVADITDGTIYKDSELERDTEYTYNVRAYDEAGNISDASSLVSGYTSWPSITDIIPTDKSEIGGQSQVITVVFTDSGNSTGNKVYFEYKESGTDVYFPISDAFVSQQNYSSGKLAAKCTWILPKTSGSYVVKATLYDEDNNTCEKEVEYNVVSSAPELPTDFKAQSDNGLIVLTWMPSTSEICAVYNIYRLNEETKEYELIAPVVGKDMARYVDSNVEVGETYFYKIEAVNSYDIASDLSQEVSVTVLPDFKAPSVSEITPSKTRINKITDINVYADDNISVEKVKLEYKSVDSEEWILLCEEIVANGKAVFQWNTLELEDGDYSIRAIATDSNNNISEEFIKAYTVDNTGIGKITLGECTTASSFVSIRWKDVTENDFGYFVVEKLNESNEFVEVGRTSQVTGMHIENLQPDTTYTFRVVGYDDLGNRGLESEVIELTTASDSISPVIRSFYPAASAFNDEIAISISAADNIGIYKVSLRYSYDSSEEKIWTDLKTITSSTQKASETLNYSFDISELPEGEIYIEAVVTDTSGNLSAECVNKYKIDHSAPYSITDLMADGSTGNVHLTWSVTDDDIKLFEIYRCEDGKTLYSKLSDCTTKDYYDTSAVFGCTYTYKIIAVDIAGNKSGESNEAITQVSDDTTIPSVFGFSYKTGAILPINPTISVVAADNYKLSKVEIEYKKSDSESDIWYELCTLDMNSSYQSVDFDWNTADLTEEKYILKAIAYDQAGNISNAYTAEYTLDLTAPEKPVAALLQGNWELTVQWDENIEDDFEFYRLYRKSDSDTEYTCVGDTKLTSYTDTTVTPEKMYSYKVEAYDKSGNFSSATTTYVRPGNVDTVKPIINVPEVLYGIAGNEIELDGSECTDNVRISLFTWTINGEYDKYGVKSAVKFDEPGTYSVKLKVEDAAENYTEAEISVVVMEKTEYGRMQVEVVDDSGRPIKYAYVYLYSSENSSEINLKANSDGIATISAPLGKSQVAVYKDGYLPVRKEIEINSVSNNEKLRVVLQSGELVTGSLSVHRMSLEEMIEAGIDFNDPDNYHTYTFTIELTFAQEPIPTVIEYHYVGGAGGNGGGSGGGSGGGYGGGGFIGGSSGSVKLSDGSTVKIQPIVYEKTEEIEEEIPILAYVRTTESISFMKDIYAVDLGVINNATSEFVIKDCSATLNLPEGLSLATNNQSLTQSMGDIAGQEKKTITWAVRGDKKGEYSLDANFSGTLMPFNAPVYANFKTETPFTVSAGDGINIYIYPESAGYIGKDYYIQFAVTNEGTDTFYNLKTTFGPAMNPGYEQDITVIYPDGTVAKQTESGACYQIPNVNECRSVPVISNGQSIRVGIFEPGDVIYGTYTTVFAGAGDPEEVYYKLIDSVVTEWTDSTNVKVHVSAIPSHITKYNVKHEIVQDTWADPVDMTTGAFTDSLTALSVTGDSVLSFDLNYNSLNSGESGQLGFGWSHDFEIYLDVTANNINVHWSQSNYATFVSENLVLRNVDGTISNNEIVLHTVNDTGAKNYIPISTGLDGYKLSRDDNGIYTLTAPGGARNVFDETGKLIKIIAANGKSTNLEHIGNSTVISDEITGAKIILNYNDAGHVTSVTDGTGREAIITYNNGLITRVTNALGDAICYEYDENNRLITASVAGESSPYVTNKYDEYGRVIEQDDADESTPLTYFKYEEENGKFIAIATDRNNVYDEESKTNSHQVTYVSDGLGHVISFTDQNKNTTYYSYDTTGNLIFETDALGNTTAYTYDDNNWLTSIKDADGNTTKMTYDSKGNILSVEGPDGEKNVYTYNADNLLETTVENSGARKSYTYNDYAQISSETIEGLGTKFYNYTDGRLTSTVDFMGNTSSMTYDAYGNVSSVTERDGNTTTYLYDALNRLVSETTEDGTISYTYDSRGNQTKVTDVRGNIVNYYYNSNNLLEKLETAKGITAYSYDNEGRIISQTNHDATVYKNEYDPAGNLIKSINENGEISEYAYDVVGNVKTKTLHNGEEKYTESYEYYSNGKLKKVTFADGTSESYEYDSSWRITKITDGLGNSTVTEYDGNGNVLSVTDAEGYKIQYTYDKYGRMLTLTDANGNVTTFDKYDKNGNCLQKTLPSGQIISLSYNNEGMPTMITLKSDEEDISIFYEYDAAGRVKKYTDEEGNEFITEYDAAGNITRLVDAYGNTIQENTYDELNYLSTSVDALGIETQYTYDSVGNLKSIIENLNTAREAETVYSYDNVGRITQSVDAENGTSSYEYDKIGNIIAQIDPNGGRSEYSYDSMCRITASITPLGSRNTYSYNAVGLLEEAENARGQKTEYTYYKNGWIKSFTDELGTVSYTYDGNGNVLTVTDENGTITREYNSMNQVTKYTDFRGNTIDYSYDQRGNLVAISYPGGRIVRYTYYKNGNIKTVTDWDGRVTEYEYDGNGRLTKTTRPDGSVETRKYDVAGRMISQSDVNGETIICQRDYAYDESGNITSIDTTNSMGVIGLSSAEMVYNENNQLIEYNGETVKYDADGNMIYGPLNGSMAEFKYDCRNRLISAGGVTYSYDAENNRISKTSGDETIEYVVDSVGSLTRILTASTDSETTYYVYGTGLIGQEKNDEYLVYHYNNIGSTEAITDINGEIVERFEYGPYGELLSENKNGIIFLYNGEYGVSTDENGLYYMRARYYNPEIKRFINQDVLIGTITDSPTLNRYAYVEGNPISLADPFGLSPAINWGNVGHTILSGLTLLTLVPTPVTYAIGSAAAIANACWFASEGNYFAAVSSAIPVFGGGFSLLNTFNTQNCLLMNILKFSTAGLSIGTGGYDIYQVGKENYQKYYIDGEEFSWGDAFLDTVRIALDATEIAGGIKLATEPIPYCFVAGTLVATEDGQKPIEEIQAGDKVLSENPETGEVAYKTVEETYVNETTELVHVFVNGEEIVTTPSHPFYVPKFGWTLAINLRAGDVLVLSNGEYLVVEAIQHEILESPIKVYNFEVEDFHTYFVGESSVLVHNKCPESRETWGPEHGTNNSKHNNAIEDELDNAYFNGATDIYKNKQQIDVNGEKIYYNGNKYRKPDASYTLEGVRYNTNYVSNINNFLNEFDAFLDIYFADLDAINRLIINY